MSAGWDPPPGVNYPQCPTNGTVTSAFLSGVLDVRWDDPTILNANVSWVIRGVNIYRSDGSDRGPYKRLNAFPVGGTLFRDFTDVALVSREMIPWDTGWQSRGDASNDRRWTFKTAHPIHKRGTQGISGNSPEDVYVTIDGIPVRVSSVFGPNGEVTLVDVPDIDPGTQRNVGPTLPTENSIVLITYYTLRNLVAPEIDKKVYYRITTVAVDPTVPGGLRETPLDQTYPVGSMDIENLDYIWKEAIRRNQWILEQGGERVRLFVMKVAGVPCQCDQTDPKSLEFNKQPSNRCRSCFGTGWVGGYEGPYDVIVAPDDSERRVSQSEYGRRKEHTYEVFMGPSPVMSQRDFMVKQNNDRYSIGPVRRPSARGNILQQHFNIAYIEANDIRYLVPIDGYENITWPGTRYTYYPWRLPRDVRTDPAFPVTPDNALPMGTDDAGDNPSTEERGRTPAWENIVNG